MFNFFVFCFLLGRLGNLSCAAIVTGLYSFPVYPENAFLSPGESPVVPPSNDYPCRTLPGAREIHFSS